MKRPSIRAVAFVFSCVIVLSPSLLLDPVTTASTFVRTLPEPAMAIGGEVDSSSCVTGPVCVSLGWNHHSNTSYIWAARWQDGGWSKLPSPPKENVTGVGSPTISCTTKQWCMTTGSTGSSKGSHSVADELIG